jgi:hypothetical protein
MENDATTQNDRRLRLFDVIGVALALLGAVLIGLGWYSVHDKGSVVEQIPYLASGAVGGLAAVIGGISVVYLTRQFRLEREVARLATGQAEIEAAVRTLVAGLGGTADMATTSAVVSDRRRGGRLAHVEQLSVSEPSR